MARVKLIALRLAATFAAKFATALLVAVFIAVLDLYITGQSLPSLGRPWIDAPWAGVALSRADVMLLALVLAAGATAWWGSGRLLSPGQETHPSSHSI